MQLCIAKRKKNQNFNVKNGLGDLMSIARGVTDKMLDLIRVQSFQFQITLDYQNVDR